MAALASMTPEQELRLRSHDDLIGLVRRLESDKLSLISEHSAVMYEVNRRLQTHLVEIRALRDANVKAEAEMHMLRSESAQRARASAESRLAAERSAAEMQRLKESAERSAAETRRLHESAEQTAAEARELRELCCFLDDDRQRLRRLAEQWQRHGQYVTASLLDQDLASFAARASELEQKQNAFVEENARLRELCLFLDDERNAALAAGATAGRLQTVTEGPAPPPGTRTAPAAAALPSGIGFVPTAGVDDRRRGLGDGASSLPTASVHPAAPATISKSDVEAGSGDAAASYIKALEAEVQSLELERNRYQKILEVRDSLDRLPNTAASLSIGAPTKPTEGHVPAMPPGAPNGRPQHLAGLSIPLDKLGTGIQQSEKAIVQELCNVLWRKLGNRKASLAGGARFDPQGGSAGGAAPRQGPQDSNLPAEGLGGGSSSNSAMPYPLPSGASVVPSARNAQRITVSSANDHNLVATVAEPVLHLPAKPSQQIVSTARDRQLTSSNEVATRDSAVALNVSLNELPRPGAAAASLATAALPQQPHVSAAAAPNRVGDVLLPATSSSSHGLPTRPAQSEPVVRCDSSTDRYTSFVVTGNAHLPNGGDRLQVRRLVDDAGRSAGGGDVGKDSGGYLTSGGTAAVFGRAQPVRTAVVDVSVQPSGLPPSHTIERLAPAGGSREYAADRAVPSSGDRPNTAFASYGDASVTSRDVVAPAGVRTDILPVHQQQHQRSDASSRSGSVSSTGSWHAAAAAAPSSGAGGSRRLPAGSDYGVPLQPSATVTSQPVAIASAAVGVRAASAVSPSGSSSSSGSTERLAGQRLATRVPFTRPFIQQPPPPPEQQLSSQQQQQQQQRPHVSNASQAPNLRLRSYHGDSHQLL